MLDHELNAQYVIPLYQSLGLAIEGPNEPSPQWTVHFTGGEVNKQP